MGSIDLVVTDDAGQSYTLYSVTGIACTNADTVDGSKVYWTEGKDLDINMGCPAPKIVSGGAGSKLMLDPDLCGRIVEQVVAHTSRPVTVKMRKGWDADHVTAVECAKACRTGRCGPHRSTRPDAGADVHPASTGRSSPA